MIRYNIVIPKKFTKNGEEKTIWHNVGTLVKFEDTPEKQGGFIMELHMFPDVPFKIFKQENKKNEAPKQKKPIDSVEYDGTEEVIIDEADQNNLDVF